MSRATSLRFSPPSVSKPRDGHPSPRPRRSGRGGAFPEARPKKAAPGAPLARPAGSALGARDSRLQRVSRGRSPVVGGNLACSCCSVSKRYGARKGASGRPPGGTRGSRTRRARACAATIWVARPSRGAVSVAPRRGVEGLQDRGKRSLSGSAALAHGAGAPGRARARRVVGARTSSRDVANVAAGWWR